MVMYGATLCLYVWVVIYISILGGGHFGHYKTLWMAHVKAEMWSHVRLCHLFSAFTPTYAQAKQIGSGCIRGIHLLSYNNEEQNHQSE